MFQSLEYKHPKFYQVFRLFIVFFASLLYAWNLRCFAKTAGLFPGGFSGLSLLLQQIGCYEEKQKTLIYSVINSEAKRELLPLIRQIDPHAFINVVRTEELAGRFHDIPHD